MNSFFLEIWARFFLIPHRRFLTTFLSVSDDFLCPFGEFRLSENTVVSANVVIHKSHHWLATIVFPQKIDCRRLYFHVKQGPENG